MIIAYFRLFGEFAVQKEAGVEFLPDKKDILAYTI